MTITKVYYLKIIDFSNCIIIPAYDLFLIQLNENQKVIIHFLCYSIQELFCNTYWSMFIIINDFINLMINKMTVIRHRHDLTPFDCRINKTGYAFSLSQVATSLDFSSKKVKSGTWKFLANRQTCKEWNCQWLKGIITTQQKMKNASNHILIQCWYH